MRTPASEHSRYSIPTYCYYVLAVLTAANTLNVVDRQILVILQEPIKADLGLSDTQLGLLTGFAFAVFYVTFGIPIARWADHSIRRNIIAWAVAIWSLMTAACGLAQSYSQLVLARIGVGIGEAGCSPPAHSMISDIFSPQRRGTALSVYSVGINLGILIGFLLGGWIGEIFGWRTALFFVGVPGVLLAAVVRFTIEEPPRGWSQNTTSAAPPPPFRAVFRLLASRRSFRHLAIGAGLNALVVYGVLSWLPSYFIREFGLGIGEIGTWLALTGGFAGGIGTFLGGYLGDRLAGRDQRWYLWLPALSMMAAVPLVLFMFSWRAPYPPLICNIVLTLLFHVFLAPLLAVTHGLVGLRMRALASAILFFILNLIGMGIGPTFVGFLSDVIAPTVGDRSLRYALIVIVTIAGIWSSVHYCVGTRTLRSDLAASLD